MSLDHKLEVPSLISFDLVERVRLIVGDGELIIRPIRKEASSKRNK